MDVVNFDGLKAQGKIIDPADVDPNEDYFLIGKYTNHYRTNSMKATKYPIYAIKAGDVMGTLPAYKVYSALLTQTGINPPVATVLENTLGGTIIWTYNSVGEYYGTLINTFKNNKTFVLLGMDDAGHIAGGIRQTDDIIYVFTSDMTGGYIDSAMQETSIEIRVYN